MTLTKRKMGVSQNENLKLLNTVLLIVYVVWFLGRLFTTRV